MPLLNILLDILPIFFFKYNILLNWRLGDEVPRGKEKHFSHSLLQGQSLELHLALFTEDKDKK